MFKKSVFGFLAFLIFLTSFLSSAPLDDDFPVVMSMRERKAAVDRMTMKRLEQLLPKVMREAGFDMWVLISNEDNYDPVFLTMVPYDAWCPITQILVFYDPGEGKPIERLNISRTNMEGLHETVWKAPPGEDEGKNQWETLAKVIREKNPKRIGINESDLIWAADGLTASLKRRLVKTIGEEYGRRLASAEKMSTLWLETLLDEELDLYECAVAISHALIAETFSNKVITPGVTTPDDLVFHYRQRTAELGLEKAFRPFFRILGRHPEMQENYPLEEDKTIRRGDILQCDVGIKYLRYNTDTQEMAYVLRRGETDVPEGIKAGIAEGNKLQDIFCGEFREGLTGNQMLANILRRAKAEGIEKPRVYSHSVGYCLHEPGPLIGLPWEQVNTGARGEVRLVPNSCFTVELSVDRPVPEWGGQEFRFKLEQDIVYTKKGVYYLDGRQTEFHVIK